MLKKKLTKLVGISIDDFQHFNDHGQIQFQEARLIPTLKTGDEMALTSIFLSSLRLIKEFREGIFKEIKLSRSGKAYYFTEVCFPDLDKSRIDGLIIIVKAGTISEAAFFEMKNKASTIDAAQVSSYISIAKQLNVGTMVTVSNEFVADPSHSPVKAKIHKGFSLYHFSWTYILTRGHLLLFKNEDNIKDIDQVEIMRESLAYLESPVSGVSGYTQMKPGWKELSENIRAQKQPRITDKYVEDAVLSWYEEEKDMALQMSRRLGVLVKSSAKNSESIKNDIKRVCQDNFLAGSLSVKDSVSDIKLVAEFERRTVSMSVKITPPLDKGLVGKISWIARQLENCEKKSPKAFGSVSKGLWIEADVKYARENIKVKLSNLDQLAAECQGKEIQAFVVCFIQELSAGFASQKKFVQSIESMVFEFYEGIVQHMTNWNRPAPKLIS